MEFDQEFYRSNKEVMIYQQLGNSDLQISRIGFGCMSLKPYQPVNEKILHQAIEYGINYFDTADLYDKGANEELLGNVFKEKRNQVILATKAGNQWRSDGSGWEWNPRKQYILKSAEQSLQRLQTDHIDLYQLHGGTMDDPIEETIEAFELLVRQGKIRYYGISSIRPNVIKHWVKHSNIISVMMQYSLLDRRPEEECLGVLKQNNIGVLTRGSIAQGLLVNKPAKPYLNYSTEDVQKASAAMLSLSNEKRTTAQTAIQYVLHHPAIVSAIVGIRTMKQLEDSVKTIETSLSETEIKTLQDTLPPNQYSEHR